jgi:hypothetical protein
MDPFIEDRGLWPDFHDDLIAEIERNLAAQLPERYFIQTGERTYVVLAGTNEKGTTPICPDPRIKKPAAASQACQGSSGAVTMQAFIDQHFRENFIEIYTEEPQPRLVTCIEVLSPANKQRGNRGWKLYLRKRNALLLGKANLVEIDLLRGGRRMPMVEPWPKSPYYLLVGREDHAPYCRVWPVYFNQPLPEIPVPLASPDRDVPLALQPMIEAVYERSRYGRRLQYDKPLTTLLSPEDAAWLAQRLRGGSDQGSKPAATRQRKGRRR